MIHELKVIVADIDGTLVNTKREMMPLTRMAINDLHRRGVLFGIASGRPIGDHMRERPLLWNLDFYPDFIIGLNGGQIEDCQTKEYAEFYKLSKETVKEILEAMCLFKVNPFVYVGEDFLLLKEDEKTMESLLRNKNKAFFADDISALYSEERGNILFRLLDEADMPRIEAYLAANPSKDYIGFKTQSWLVEFNDPRVNKGVALQDYCLKHQISLDQVMAFGDTSNDNGMLEIAGWPVCMQNGTDDTKALAKDITLYSNDEDGVGRYLLDVVYPSLEWKVKR